MVVAVMAVKVFLCYFILLSPQKKSFTGVNSICYSFRGETILDERCSHLMSCLWVYKSVRGLYVRPKHSLKLLLILAGDIELCPGPTVKCNICNKTVRKKQKFEKCSGCSIKIHLECSKNFIVIFVMLLILLIWKKIFHL